MRPDLPLVDVARFLAQHPPVDADCLAQLRLEHEQELERRLAAMDRAAAEQEGPR